MPYQIPEHINPNKVFLVNHSALEGRLDPQYYEEHFDFHNFVKLSSIAKVSGGKRIPLGKDYSLEPTGFLYLRVADIQDEGIVDYNQFKCIDKDVFETLKRYEIYNGNLAISIAGTVGKVVIIKGIPNDKHVILTENCAKITIINNDILAEYFYLMLSMPIVQRQIELNYIQTTIPKLGLDRVNGLMLPQPPSIASQQEIIKIYNVACSQKLKKEQQAEALLQSIDDYLLGELGILLPETKSQTIQDRMFVVNHSELSGDRLDPMFYTSPFSNIVDKLHDSTTCKRLGQIAHFSSEIWNQRDYYEKEFPYIEIGAINITDGTIEDVSFVPVEQAPSRAKVIVRTGDIIISTTRPDRGAIIKIAENENLYIASTGFSVIRNIDSNINPDYLLAILRHKLILMQMRQRSTGGNYPAITQEELSKIIIPILPIPKQQEIVDHISSIRQQAKALQEEGKAILEQAKKEVEQMILG